MAWTAPERLALTSLLHGGPTPDIGQYTVLELGCGVGANLIPLAYYRPQAQFTGMDLDRQQINIADARSHALHQPNLRFKHLDLQHLDQLLDQLKAGPFDFILVHDLVSKVPLETLDSLLATCQSMLSEQGLLYLNYDCKPGWNIRGMVREYLLAHTQDLDSLSDKMHQAQIAAAKMVRSLSANLHPYSQLLVAEFRLVGDADSHELARTYLNPYQAAYWRSELNDWARQFGLHYVADADYNTSEHHHTAKLRKQIESQDLVGTNLADTEDLLNYRLSHAPIFCRQPIHIRQHAPDKIARLNIAACLHPVGPHRPGWYQHPSGYQLQASEPEMSGIFDRLLPLWPDSTPLAHLPEPWEPHLNDLVELHHSGLLELRIPNATGSSTGTGNRSESTLPDTQNSLNPLNQLELEWQHYYTTARHHPVSR
ncbi:MAG: class I SAM-dependent methyltransferase [Pseudomonadota bacterium]|nr:class I SAM-dependent methyltransferase [Pseudomonadota bacterium]